jgi:hypothetical protein
MNGDTFRGPASESQTLESRLSGLKYRMTRSGIRGQEGNDRGLGRLEPPVSFADSAGRLPRVVPAEDTDPTQIYMGRVSIVRDCDVR